MLTTQIRYWLARRICRRYARGYMRDVDRMGLEWTLALIDEDVELHGHPFNHALARPGTGWRHRLRRSGWDDLVASASLQVALQPCSSRSSAARRSVRPRWVRVDQKNRVIGGMTVASYVVGCGGLQLHL